MAKRAPKPINYSQLESVELVWLAQANDDRQADCELLTRKEEVMRRLVRNCVRKYTFVDPDDLYQSLVIQFFKIVRNYRPGKETGWDKYCYHCLTFGIKDILRQRDDLGIKWPQKKMYPEWFHLYDTTKSDTRDGNQADAIRDHRLLSDSDREWLEFYDALDLLRQSLADSLCQPRERFPKPAVHDVHPIAWTSGDSSERAGFSFAIPSHSSISKRGRHSTTSRLNLNQWRKTRSKPKQMVMF